MGFYFTLLYMIFLICSPAALFPGLAPYRIQWWMTGLALAATLPSLPVHGYPIRNRQMILVVLLLGEVMLSRVMRGWFGGAVFALMEFGSTLIIFFLLVAGAPSITRLRAISVALILPAFYACFRGIMAVFTGWEAETYILYQNVIENWVIVAVVERIRFLGFFNDPNDLAQYFLVCLPLVALLWRKGAMIRNVVLVLPLIGYLLFGMYLTHSRGVVLGLIVMVMLYFADRVNKVLALFGAGILAVGLIAANLGGGGRSISFSQGADRIEAWGAGLTMLRDNPIFGIGYNLFVDYNFLTAHNSFVLCFAELGMLGFFLWLALLVTTLKGLSQMIARFQAAPGGAEVARWAKALRLSMAGFVATSWFLSRTYSVLLYVLVAMWIILDQYSRRLPVAAPPPAAVPEATPVYATAGRAAATAPYHNQPAPVRFNAALPPSPAREPGWHWATTTIVLQIACVALVYFLVRARWAN